MVKTLFDLRDDQLTIIANGTYCSCQKSTNNMIQRKLYSGHKKRPLVKPFVVTTTTGKIIDIYGNYGATDNDASIMEDVLNRDKNLKELILKNDLAIFDRAFKDCILRLKKKYGLISKIPTCLKDGEKQMTCKEANETRLITKNRYVVEVINGILKQQFKALRETP
ncbi:unnamed protein product, partial [Brachionus calyciflorus]